MHIKRVPQAKGAITAARIKEGPEPGPLRREAESIFMTARLASYVRELVEKYGPALTRERADALKALIDAEAVEHTD